MLNKTMHLHRPALWIGLVLFVVGCQNTPDHPDPVLSPAPTPNVSAVPTPTPTPQPALSQTTPTPSPANLQFIALQKYLEGSKWMREGRYEEALNAFLDAHLAKPDSALICSSAADALLHSGLLKRAEKLALRSIEIDPDHVEGHSILAQCYLALQEEEKALSHYQFLLNHDPYSLEYLTQLANLYVSLQRRDEAVPLYRTILQLDPPQSDFYRMQLAFILFHLERYHEALREYQQLVQALPESFEAHLQLGIIHEHLGQENEAIDAYLKAFNTIHSPQDELLVRRKLAHLYKKRKANKEAVFQYEKIKELSPDDFDARAELVELLTRQGGQPAALREINEMIARFPDDLRVYEQHFDVLSRFGKRKEAYQSYLDGLEYFIRQNQTEQAGGLLDILLQNARLDEMKQFGQIASLQSLLQRYAELEPSPPDSYFARLFFDQWSQHPDDVQAGQHQLIRAVLKANQERDIDRADLLSGGFVVWHQARKTFLSEPLRTQLTQALQSGADMFPSLANPSRALGALAVDQSDWHAAEKQFQTALTRLPPGSTVYKEVLFELVWTYDRLNRFADAEQLLSEAAEMYPDDAYVYNALGYLYAERDIHLEKALSLIEKALKLAPEDADILDSMGWVYYRLGHYSKALDVLNRAYQTATENPVIALHLGDVHHAMGNPETALPYWEQALEHHEDYPWDFSTEKVESLQQKINRHSSQSKTE